MSTSTTERTVEDTREAATDPTQLVQHAFEVREVDTASRTIVGIAAPYGQTIKRGGFFFNWKERFEKGAFDGASDVMLFYGHTDPIGLVVKHEDVEAGHQITARISETAKGDEVYTLLRDGVLKKFSVGFFPLEHRVETDPDTDEETIVRTKVDLREVSVVPIPAYSEATITDVRSHDGRGDHPNQKEVAGMGDSTAYATAADLDEVRGQVEETSRQLVAVRDGSTVSDDTMSVLGQYASAGHLLKALRSGEAREHMDAINTAFTRAFEGATTVEAGVRPAWVDRALRLIEEKRPILDLFDKAPLPESGLSFDYPEVKSASGTVGKQQHWETVDGKRVSVGEGTDLPYMEVVIGEARAEIETYGGYASLSRQSIERSSVAYLATVWLYMVRQYAKRTNIAVQDALAVTTGGQTAELAAFDAKAVIELFLESGGLLDDNALGAEAEFAVASGDVFAGLATIMDNAGRPVFAINNDGSNTIGRAALRQRRIVVDGLEVREARRLPAGTLKIGSSEAITVAEQAGAPLRLEDENIINLTKDFSLYGYMSVARTAPKALVHVDVTGALAALEG